MQSPNLKAYVFDLASLINKRSGNNKIDINKNKIDVINQIYKEGKNTIIIEVFIKEKDENSTKKKTGEITKE